MKTKSIFSIVIFIVAIISFIIFIRSASDIKNFVTALWSCLTTSVSVAVLIVLNPWLIGKN